jgi:hypothetical protein
MFVKGHKQGRGNSNSGRQTKAEVVAGAIKSITNEALIELAKQRVFAEMGINDSYNATKDLSLPVVLKQMKEFKEINVKLPKPLDNMGDILEHKEQKTPLDKN